ERVQSGTFRHGVASLAQGGQLAVAIARYAGGRSPLPDITRAPQRSRSIGLKSESVLSARSLHWRFASRPFAYYRFGTAAIPPENPSPTRIFPASCLPAPPDD